MMVILSFLEISFKILKEDKINNLLKIPIKQRIKSKFLK